MNSGLPRTNPDSSRVEDLNQGPPDFKSSALNHSATLPPLGTKFVVGVVIRSVERYDLVKIKPTESEAEH